MLKFDPLSPEKTMVLLSAEQANRLRSLPEPSSKAPFKLAEGVLTFDELQPGDNCARNLQNLQKELDIHFTIPSCVNPEHLISPQEIISIWMNKLSMLEPGGKHAFSSANSSTFPIAANEFLGSVMFHNHQVRSRASISFESPKLFLCHDRSQWFSGTLGTWSMLSPSKQAYSIEVTDQIVK